MGKNNVMKGEAETKGWKDGLQQLIKANNHLRDNGKPARTKTQHERATYLFKMFKDLHKMGYGVQPRNFKEKHIQVVCDKFVSDRLAAGTITSYLSFIRIFTRWIGKSGMMKNNEDYFENPEVLKRTYQAVRDKSFEGNGVDKEAVFAEISIKTPWVWIQMLVCDAFGLRLKEAVMFRPVVDVVGDRLIITKGTKGGRNRGIPIESDYQKEVIKKAIEMVRGTGEYIAEPDKTLKQNMKKVSNTMANHGITKLGKQSLGVTLHGLRVGFAIRKTEERGIRSILKGELPNQMTKEEEMRVRKEVSRMLGHERENIMNAYVPPNNLKSFNKITKAQREALSISLTTMKQNGLYRFAILEHETTSELKVASQYLIRTFIQMHEEKKSMFLMVEDEIGGTTELIPLDLIASIREV